MFGDRQIAAVCSGILFVVFVFALLTYGPISEPVVVGTLDSEYEKARQEFEDLMRQFLQEWVDWVGPESMISWECMWKVPAGRNIIAMGRRALPFVMQEIEKGNVLLTYAASQITGLRFMHIGETDYWLEWWEENKRNPTWNVFVE